MKREKHKMTGKERVLALVKGREIDHYPFMPITMQFASKIIGKPYKEYASDFRVLTEGQLAVAEMFAADHVSVISDPAREAEACGAGVHWKEDAPPFIDESRAVLNRKNDLVSLCIPDPRTAPRMADRINAVQLLSERTGCSLIVEGWVEGPCAEGADLRGINQLMIDFFDDPQFVGDLFSFTYEMGLDFAKAQLTAGADIIGVGDAAASLIGPELYHQFVYPYEKKLVDGIHDAGGMVRLHICGNISSIIKSVSSLGCEIVDIDYPVDLSWAREQAGPDQILLGNIDPVKVLRDGTSGTVADHLSACMAAAAPNWIAGAGCEVTGDTPHENLTAMSLFARGHGNSNYKY